MQTEHITPRPMPTLRQREATHALSDLFGTDAPMQRIAPPLAGKAATLSDEHRTASTVEIGRRFTALVPMLSRLAGARTTVTLETGELTLQARIVPADFDAAMRDLVAHACAAGAESIAIRARRVGQRIWLLVADDGRAMTRPELTRIGAFVRSAHGRLRIHGRPVRGTAICMILPAVLTLAAGEPGARIGRLTPKKEKSNAQDRQSVAA